MSEKTSKTNRLLTARQAAELLGCTPHHVRLLVRRGLLRATKRKLPAIAGGGHYYLIARREVEKYRDGPHRQPLKSRPRK